MYRTIIFVVLCLHSILSATSVDAQTVQRQDGTLHLTQQLSTNITTASDLAGAILGVTYASGEFKAEADCDLSGTVNFGDIPAFIEILISQ